MNRKTLTWGSADHWHKELKQTASLLLLIYCFKFKVLLFNHGRLVAPSVHPQTKWTFISCNRKVWSTSMVLSFFLDLEGQNALACQNLSQRSSYTKVIVHTHTHMRTHSHPCFTWTTKVAGKNKATFHKLRNLNKLLLKSGLLRFRIVADFSNCQPLLTVADVHTILCATSLLWLNVRLCWWHLTSMWQTDGRRR